MSFTFLFVVFLNLSTMLFLSLMGAHNTAPLDQEKLTPKKAVLLESPTETPATPERPPEKATIKMTEAEPLNFDK